MNADQATRGDVDALIALNRDYIHSVQHGDVRRFEEILADDFLCSNPDGSLVDKKQFLAQTAWPVTIGGHSAQEGKVRILGDSRLRRHRYQRARWPLWPQHRRIVVDLSNGHPGLRSIGAVIEERRARSVMSRACFSGAMALAPARAVRVARGAFAARRRAA
jgi:hypothetical protein